MGRASLAVLTVALLSALAVSAACNLAPVSEPKEQKLDKIKVAYGALVAAQGALWATQEADLFKKYGLDVEFAYLSSGSTVVQAMIAGEVPLASIAGLDIAQANLAGSDLALVIGINDKVVQGLMTVPDIKTPAQLKGKKLGVPRYGAATDFALRFGLRHLGLDPEKDVAIVQVGGLPETLAAMQNGAIQGGALAPPHWQKAVKMGYTQLLDLTTIDYEYPMSEIATSRAFLKSNDDIMKRFAKAYLEGTRRYKTDKPFAKKVLAKYMKTEDEEVLDESYEAYAKLMPEVPYPSVSAMKNVLDGLVSTNSKAKEVDPASYIERRYVKELEDSGFTKQLWEKGR